MVSTQTLVLLGAIAVGAATLCCLIRLQILQLSSVYPALTYFLAAQFLSTVISHLIGVQSGAYEAIYLVLLTLELLSYVLMIREIYGTIFSAYPGIAVLGRWCIYGTLAITTLIAIISVLASKQQFLNSKSVLPLAETAAHCLILGFGCLIVVILVTISRYPLQLHRNVLLNAIFFSGILLGEAVGMIIEIITWRSFTQYVNLAMSFNTLLWLAVWPIVLSREGETRVRKLHRNRNPADEARLLRQLDTLNTLLLRTKQR